MAFANEKVLVTKAASTKLTIGAKMKLLHRIKSHQQTLFNSTSIVYRLTTQSNL